MKIEKIKSENDDIELELAIFEPKDNAKGIIQFSHGMAEHKERYFDFMKYLSDHGYICIIHDHRGHGKSVKDKNDLGYFYTENINYIVDDLHQITEYMKEKYPNLKVMLFSHSMGTLVARNYLKKYDEDISKIVLCGPPTENKLTGFAICLAKTLKPFYGKNKANKFLNKMAFKNFNKNLKLDNEWICSKLETVENYNKDEYCGFVFTTNGFINLFKLMKGAFVKKDWEIQNASLPIFVIAGKNDPVIQNENKFNKLINFLEKLGYKNIKSKLYDNMRHEILNEKDNISVYQDILHFFDK